MINYLIGDCIVRMDVAYRFRKKNIVIIRSNCVLKILDVLYRHGCILYYFVTKVKKVIVYLKYWKNNPVWINIRLVSKPGLRIYKGLDLILRNDFNLMGFFIISTWCGIFSSVEIILYRNLYRGKMGGEIILFVFF